MNSANRLAAVIVVFGAISRTSAVDYHLERITPTLNQPTFITQAPGDPTNILYYTTRISGNASGFSASNPMGAVWRYDLATRTSTVILRLSSRSVVNDDGLQVIAFHPDFNNSGSNGYGKMYVSSAQSGGTALDRVEEYVVLNPDGTFKTTNQVAATARVVLRYNNNTQNNHTVDWLGFDPNATGVERDYLYISTGDASFGNNYNGGISPTGRPSQNPTDVRGKILRVDISGADDYPADTNKNFAIPPSNPIPTYNAAHPGAPITGLGEVYITGVRNGYRVSFDRANSDLYWGDVGEFAYEEVNFLKAGGNVSGPPVDYGWPQLEATHGSNVPGAPQTTTNPFTGVIAYYPLREWPHTTAGNAAIGGYVYRGPIPELQGKYFYADFVTGKIWMLDFDRNTNPGTFQGTNGIQTEVTSLWNSLIIDRSTNNYSSDTNLATQKGIDHVVSFGEDKQGNLYIVDFGYGTTFDGQYTANAGEIFELVPGPLPPTLTWTNLGSSIRFAWSGNFKLQARTNSISANWADYPGGTNSPVIVPLDLLQQTAFFRLLWPP